MLLHSYIFYEFLNKSRFGMIFHIMYFMEYECVWYSTQNYETDKNDILVDMECYVRHKSV
jgi:hypothetical protein